MPLPRFVMVSLSVIVLVGCPNGKPKGDLPPLHPAKGKLTRGGQAVTGGTVRFIADPEVPDLIVTADIGREGTFELKTFHAVSQKMGNGAPLGNYKVSYYMPQSDQVAGGQNPVIEVQQRVTIKEGPNDLTIEIGKK